MTTHLLHESEGLSDSISNVKIIENLFISIFSLRITISIEVSRSTGKVRIKGIKVNRIFYVCVFQGMFDFLDDFLC